MSLQIESEQQVPRILNETNSERLIEVAEYQEYRESFAKLPKRKKMSYLQ